MVSVNLSKRDFFWIGLIIVLTFVGFGYSHGGNNPEVMGHSEGEIEGVCLTDGTGCDGANAYADSVAGNGSSGPVSWGDITGIPSGFRDNVDNAGGVVSSSCYAAAAKCGSQCASGYAVTGLSISSCGGNTCGRDRPGCSGTMTCCRIG